MHNPSSNKECVESVFRSICMAVDSPVSLGAWLRFKHGSHKELAEMKILPQNYCSGDSFNGDYGVVSFLSKWKGLKTGINKRAVAVSKFRDSEIVCARTNSKLVRERKSASTADLSSIFFASQRKISNLLGPVDWSKLSEGFGWGPGATFEFTRSESQLDRKVFELPITVTRSALNLLKSTIENDLHWSYVILGVFPSGLYSLLPSCFCIVEGCRITTVDKNAKTDRVIAVEPRGNLFLQKGIGSYFRSRLRAVGVDLDNQEINQEAAQAALSENLATLDLKAASDTICREIVYDLLPLEWSFLLERLRSPRAKLGGEWIKLEKFSSMGNGFTFELESLIFWSLCKSAIEFYQGEGKLCVYGDDLIVPQQCANEVIKVLEFAGFEVNTEKSYTSGLFFESCGKHFFDGRDVTPAYQKELVDSEQEVIRLCNRISRLAFRWGDAKKHDLRLRNAWLAGRRFIAHQRFQIPFGDEGDDALLCVYDDFDFRHRRINSSHGILCDVYSQVLLTLPAREDALLAWSMRRGIETEVPYLGSISIAVDGRYRAFHRWVIPSGKFSSTWR